MNGQETLDGQLSIFGESQESVEVKVKTETCAEHYKDEEHPPVFSQLDSNLRLPKWVIEEITKGSN